MPRARLRRIRELCGAFDADVNERLIELNVRDFTERDGPRGFAGSFALEARVKKVENAIATEYWLGVPCGK